MAYHFGKVATPSELIGQTLGHYRILEQIGAGGMGVVFRAHDERLDRDVALKVLPAGALADETARQRFRKEALALAKLNHPNIAHVYDFDTDNGIDFLVMEYISGITIAQKLADGPLFTKQVLDFGEQIATTLEDAHENGILHCDLKPGNVMVTSKGQLKLLDFGLARLLKKTGGDFDVTRSTLIAQGPAGTLGYMAPEQLRDEEPKVFSDIYALGAVLYEMSTGQGPFQEKNSILLAEAILNRQPTMPSSLNPRVSPGLEAVIIKALDKQPECRYQSARELAMDLRTLSVSSGAAILNAGVGHRGTPAVILATVILMVLVGYTIHRFLPSNQAPTDKVALVVLPFQVLTDNADVDFLGVAIADAVTTRLAGVAQLRLRPTTAVLPYQKQGIDSVRAGRALATDYVITGTVQRNGSHFRINAQLVRVSDGASVWGESYDLTRADLLSLEDALAEQIANSLRIRITTAERQRLYRRYTDNSAAYEHYMKGRAEVLHYTEESTKAAIEAFESALRLDAKYALAHAGLATASAMMRIRFAPEAEVRSWEERAHKEAQQALMLDPDLAEAHEALASVYRNAEFDWDRTIQESNRALELNPNLEMPHYYRAAAFYHLGLLELVEPEVRAGTDINPAARSEPLRIRGTTALFMGRFEDAERLLTELRSLSGGPISDWYLAIAVYYTGERERAQTLLLGLQRSAQAERRSQATLASFLAAAGHKRRASALVGSVVSGGYLDHHVAYSLGVAYAQMREPREALHWLRRAAETGFPCYPWFERDPLLKPLRGYPDFERYLVNLRSSWESAKLRYAQYG